MQKIEKFPFFKGFQGENQALIDISLFWKWMDNFAFMDEEDMADRSDAFREREKGESLRLKDAMEQW
ncbi:MAG: hypothetical protein V2I97_03415 [Desulfococcaceae bacterium]|nr:hypothetical protein [Desulfococcaceae bacterium]